MTCALCGRIIPSTQVVQGHIRIVMGKAECAAHTSGDWDAIKNSPGWVNEGPVWDWDCESCSLKPNLKFQPTSI